MTKCENLNKFGDVVLNLFELRIFALQLAHQSKMFRVDCRKRLSTLEERARSSRRRRQLLKLFVWLAHYNL